jgi:hypothetical protein
MVTKHRALFFNDGTMTVHRPLCDLTISSRAGLKRAWQLFAGIFIK